MKLAAFAIALSAGIFCACSSSPSSGSNAPPAAAQAASTQSYDPTALPKGQTGAMIRYGRELIEHTRAHMPQYVGANMECSACHVNAGTKPRGGSFAGIAAQFPQWNKRSGRTIALQDRIAECFLYSMNGRPPAYNSREMLAIVAYITYLSRGTPIGATPDPQVKLASISLGNPNVAHGSSIYTQKCSACHGAGGAGNASIFPPLWGATSFNNGAGMHRLNTMAGFVRYNMPQNAPGSLSDREAYDVAAFVLSHSRPKFNRKREVVFPAQPAGYF